VTEPRHALRRVRTHVETNAAPISVILRARGLMRNGRLGRVTYKKSMEIGGHKKKQTSLIKELLMLSAGELFALSSYF